MVNTALFISGLLVGVLLTNAYWAKVFNGLIKRFQLISQAHEALSKKYIEDTAALDSQIAELKSRILVLKEIMG